MTRRTATTRTLLGIAAPVMPREPQALIHEAEPAPPDSARVFDLYPLHAPSRAPGAGPFSPFDASPRSGGPTPNTTEESATATLEELLDSARSPMWPQGLHLVLRVIGRLIDARSTALSGTEQPPAAVLPHSGETRAADAEDSAACSIAASHVVVDVEGNIRISAPVLDGPEAVYTVCRWLYRVAVGRFPAFNEKQLPSRRNSTLPKWIDEVCVRGLTRDVSHRFQSLSALAVEIGRHSVPVRDLDVRNWVLLVCRQRRPTEFELAEELSDALSLFTQRDQGRPATWLRWTGGLLVLGMVLGIGAWLAYQWLG